MLKARDRQILAFLDEYQAAETKHLLKLFFSNVSGRRGRDRLTVLTNQGHIKRYRPHMNADYVYYLDKKTEQVQHTLIRVDVLCACSRLYKVLKFIPEFSIGEVRADAYIELQHGTQRYNFFLEVQLSNHFNQTKYEQLYNSGLWQKQMPDNFPRILVVSDRHILIKPSELVFLFTKSDLSGLTEICGLIAQ